MDNGVLWLHNMHMYIARACVYSNLTRSNAPCNLLADTREKVHAHISNSDVATHGHIIHIQWLVGTKMLNMHKLGWCTYVS